MKKYKLTNDLSHSLIKLMHILHQQSLMYVSDHVLSLKPPFEIPRYNVLT